MRITALVENTAAGGLRAVHGLSLHVETRQHRLLFDLGPDDTLFENARALGVSLEAVDTLILSHGHYDHGGALAAFLELNSQALVYAGQEAFEPHFGLIGAQRLPIGLDPALKAHPRVRLVPDDFQIDGELRLFSAHGGRRCLSPANGNLYGENGLDSFPHERHLLIRENTSALLMGCGHQGLLNILDKAPEKPALCVGGYHLQMPDMPEAAVACLAEGLRAYPDTDFYTCHCTGLEAFRALAEKVPRMRYLAGGESVTA